MEPKIDIFFFMDICSKDVMNNVSLKPFHRVSCEKNEQNLHKMSSKLNLKNSKNLRRHTLNKWYMYELGRRFYA